MTRYRFLVTLTKYMMTAPTTAAVPSTKDAGTKNR